MKNTNSKKAKTLEGRIMEKGICAILIAACLVLGLCPDNVYAKRYDTYSDKAREETVESEAIEEVPAVEEENTVEEENAVEEEAQTAEEATSEEVAENVEENNEEIEVSSEEISESGEAAEEATEEESVEESEAPVVTHFIDSDTYIKDINFDSDRVLNGAYDTEYVYFQIPEYWDTVALRGKFIIELSPMLIDVPASITFAINEVPVESFELNYADGARQELEIEIPVDKCVEGYNTLSITGFARIYDDEGCLDDLDGANWVVISKESSIEAAYNLKELELTISRYPYPIISTVNETGENITIVIPDSPDTNELTAAALIRGNIAGKTVDKDLIKIKKQKDVNLNSEISINQIIVSQYEKISADVRSNLNELGLNESKIGDTVALAIYENNDNYTLVVTSKDASLLIGGAKYLMSEELLLQAKSNIVYVNSSDISLLESNEVKMEYTVEELSGLKEGIPFQGAFHQEQTIYLNDLSGFVLGSGGTMDLNFRYSKNLDFNRALFTVYVNDTPVASKKLNLSDADEDSLKITLPEDATGTIVTHIKFAFDLDLPEIYCTNPGDETPWAFITADSKMYLPIGQTQILSFNDIPYPFSKAGKYDNTVFVLSDNMSGSELELLGQVASLYGRNNKFPGEISVITEKDFDSENMSESNIIFIGKPGNLSVLSSINEKLPFPYDSEKISYVGNEQYALSSDYAGKVAFMQLMPSSYNDSKAMLVISSTEDEAIDGLVDYLSDLSNRSLLAEDTVLVDIYGEMKSFTFLTTLGKVDKPSLKQRLEQNSQSVVFTLVSTGAMALLLLASVLILIRARAKKRDGDK